jgi:hypothetical protein
LISVITYDFRYNFTKGGCVKYTYLHDIDVRSPGTIKLSPTNKNILYAINQHDNTLSVVKIVNTTNYKVSYPVPTGKNSTGMTIDRNTWGDQIYIANRMSNTISLIDSQVKKVNDIQVKKVNVQVGPYPSNVVVNHASGVLYVTTLRDRSIDEISLSPPNKLLAPVRFYTNPNEGGYINCSGVSKPFMRYEIGQNLRCNVQPNPGFKFSYWSGDIASFSQHNTRQLSFLDQLMGLLLNKSSSSFNQNTDPQINLQVPHYGKLIANFIPNPPLLPPEFLTAFWGAISAVITSFLIPSILGWINGKRQRRNLRQYINKIDDQHGMLDEGTVRKEQLSCLTI